MSSREKLHELYFWLIVASAAVGTAVYFACDHWHETWAHASPNDIAVSGPEPLAAQYPWLSAVTAALIALVVFRSFVFMHRLESR